MRRKMSGMWFWVAAVVTVAVPSCYEYEDAPAPAGATAASATDGGTSRPAAGSSSGREAARPSHSGARGAAARTVERSDQHQRDIEKALEDQD